MDRPVYVYRSWTDSKRPVRILTVAKEIADKTIRGGVKPVIKRVTGGTLFEFGSGYLIVYGVTADDVRRAYRK